jgi:hypothetical protein
MKTIPVHLILLILLIAGCDTDKRLVQISREAADRQAEQNKEMARVNRSVAEGTKRVVTEHANGRENLNTLHQGVQAQQEGVNRQRDALESERQKIAGVRLTESRLGPLLSSLGIFLLGATTIGFCAFLLVHLYQPGDDPLGELLLEDLVSVQPKLFPTHPAIPPSGHLTETSLQQLEQKEELT